MNKDNLDCILDKKLMNCFTNCFEDMIPCNIFDKVNKNFTSLKTDIYVDDSSTYFLIDIPGVSKDLINIEYKDKFIYVTVNTIKEDIKYLKCERLHKKVTRSYYVGEIKESSINASLNEGVLKITIPNKNKTDVEVKINIL